MRRRTLTSGAGGTLALALIAAGCSGDSDEDAVRDTVERGFVVSDEVVNGDREPDALETLLTGEALQNERDYVEGMRDDELQVESQITVEWTTVEVDGDQATASVCADTTTLSIVDAGGDEVDSSSSEDYLLLGYALTRDDGGEYGWLVSEFTDNGGPESCDPDEH